MKEKYWITGLILLMVLLGISCGKRESKPVFGFVINNSGRFWDLARAGVKQAASEEGVDYDYQVPGQATAAQQKQIVEALISKGISGLAISPISPESIGRLIDEASRYFPVICQDSDAVDSKRVCYIGTENVEAGRTAGRELIKAVPDGGQFAIFVGTLDVANARERYQGIMEAIKGTRLQLVEEPFTDRVDRPTAKANVTRALAKYPELKAIVGLWNYNAPQAVMALKDNPGRQVKIIAFDEDIETLEGIRNGTIVCSVAQQPYEFGYQSIKMLAKLHRGEPADIPDNKLIYVPVQVLTPQNVDSYEAFINEKLATLEDSVFLMDRETAK